MMVTWFKGMDVASTVLWKMDGFARTFLSRDRFVWKFAVNKRCNGINEVKYRPGWWRQFRNQPNFKGYRFCISHFQRLSRKRLLSTFSKRSLQYLWINPVQKVWTKRILTRRILLLQYEKANVPYLFRGDDHSLRAIPKILIEGETCDISQQYQGNWINIFQCRRRFCSKL